MIAAVCIFTEVFGGTTYFMGTFSGTVDGVNVELATATFYPFLNLVTMTV